MKMSTFIARRLFYTIFVLFGLSVLIFVIARILPGDPARLALGPEASQAAVDQLRNQLHLNDPIWIQYAYWLSDLVHGSLGQSLVTHRDVLTDISLSLPATLELVTFSAILDVAISIPVGMLAGRRANSWFDNVTRVLSYIGVAIPSFVMAVLFLVFFGDILHLSVIGRLGPSVVVPPRVTGFVTLDSLLAGNLRAFFDAMWHLLLPSLALAIGAIAQEIRITRSSVVENIDKDYMTATESRGIPNSVLTLKYLLRPSIIPTVSVLALDISSLIANAFLVELIFVWGGMSSYGVTAMLRKDLNAIVGVVLVIGIVFAVANIVVDVIAAYVDPRIRLVEKGD